MELYNFEHFQYALHNCLVEGDRLMSLTEEPGGITAKLELRTGGVLMIYYIP